MNSEFFQKPLQEFLKYYPKNFFTNSEVTPRIVLKSTKLSETDSPSEFFGNSFRDS